MKKIVFSAAIVGLVLAWAAIAPAEVKVNIGIGIPAPAVEVNVGLPRLVIAAPPAMVVIPGTYVYFAPDVDADILFFDGYWYRPYRGGWFRASSYNGPWGSIRTVPPVVMRLPKDYRRIPPGHERIPYGQLHKNWRTWEREKHWDRHEAREMNRMERREERRDVREDRGNRDEKGDRGEHRGKGKRWQD
ncbi:MAG: hypothetical protein PHY31_08750 [Smithellaceae bacterium]|nr:hypothetical protein [Smithellaceae bacterium]